MCVYDIWKKYNLLKSKSYLIDFFQPLGGSFVGQTKSWASRDFSGVRRKEQVQDPQFGGSRDIQR